MRVEGSHLSSLRPSFLILPFVFILDRISKVLIQSHFSAGDGFTLLPGILHFTFVKNTGAAFGLFRGQTPGLILFSVIFIPFLFFPFFRRGFFSAENTSHPAAAEAAWALVAAGAAGNLYDRLRYGYVVDFIDFRVWPVFNVADTAICCGMAALILFFFRKKEAR